MARMTSNGWTKEEDGVWRHPRYPKGKDRPKEGLVLGYDDARKCWTLTVPEESTLLAFAELNFLHSQLHAAGATPSRIRPFHLHEEVLDLAYDNETNGARLLVAGGTVGLDRGGLGFLDGMAVDVREECQAENARLWTEKEARLLAEGAGTPRQTARLQERLERERIRRSWQAHGRL
jgi:hypothetical protein